MPDAGGGTSERYTTRDARLAARAVAESWDIPPDVRTALVARLGEMVTDPETRPRAFFAAARVLTTLSKQNLAVVDAAIRAEQHDELRQRLDDLEARIGESRP